jgi:pyruvate, orthophosphate dikinase
VMVGLPVTIRLLDPPLHEFIPDNVNELKALAERIKIPFERMQRKAESLHEFNPMLGHRGCRLGISFPEIYRTQVRAIMEAACELFLEEGIKSSPEIMIPLVGHWKELEFVSSYVRDEAEKVLAGFSKTKKIPIKYTVGTMIELPRACLTADKIAEHAEFFSFGTNDLTQTTYGISRDDSGVILKDYSDNKIYEKDPFAFLDPDGVGELVKIGLTRGRSTRPDLKIGICGEHGGEPSSVGFCQRAGLDYVSCSPFRIPIARLAAAQAAVIWPRKESSSNRSKKSSSKRRSKKSP